MKTVFPVIVMSVLLMGCSTARHFSVDGAQVKTSHYGELDSNNFSAKANALPWNYDLAYTIGAQASNDKNPEGFSSGATQAAVFGGTGLLGVAGMSGGIFSNGFSLSMGALGLLNSQPSTGDLVRQQWMGLHNPMIFFTRIRSGVDIKAPAGQESVVQAEYRFMSFLHQEDPSCDPSSARRDFKGDKEYEGALFTYKTHCQEVRGIPPTYVAQSLTALDEKKFPGNILYEKAYAYGSAPLKAMPITVFDELLAKTKKQYLATLAKDGWLMLYTRPDKPGRVVVRPDGKEERKPIPPKP